MCSSDSVRIAMHPSASIASSNESVTERNTAETPVAVEVNVKRDQLKLEIEGLNKKLHTRNGWKELKPIFPPEPSSQDVGLSSNEER